MNAHPLRLRVQSATAETPVIRGLVFAPEGGTFPSWGAGSHIRISLPGGGDRPYSLMALPDLPKGCWALGVLREQPSTGGSSFMHALKIGDIVRASAPINNFGLHTGNTPAILLAGGIGSTPILSMAAELQARGTPYRLPMQGARRRVSRFCCSSARLARMPSLSTMTAMSRGWISRPRSTAPPARSTSISADRQG